MTKEIEKAWVEFLSSLPPDNTLAPEDFFAAGYKARSKAERERGWTPIDQNPHSGIDWVLGFEGDTGEIGIVIFGSNPEEENPDEHADVWTDGYRIWNPTHWMPLPSEPVKLKDAE